MMRVPDEEFRRVSEKPNADPPKHLRGNRRQSSFPRMQLESPDVVIERPASQETLWGEPKSSF